MQIWAISVSARSDDMDQLSAFPQIANPRRDVIQIHQIHRAAQDVRCLTNRCEIDFRRQTAHRKINIGIGRQCSLRCRPEEENLR